MAPEHRVGELATATGLTVRTLHRYEEIGLLVPSCRTDTGHRRHEGGVARLYRIVGLTVGRGGLAVLVRHAGPRRGAWVSCTMEFLQPTSWADALAAKAANPAAVPIAGGTDLMVELNLDRRPPALLDLTRIPELAQWAADGERVRLGAGVTYRRIIDELGGRLPGLAMAARMVGSPQIRSRGTVGGNLGSASPAGDAHPPLVAVDAQVELVSVRGVRRVPVREFFTGPKRSVLAPDELISAVLVPPATGPQLFAKVGTRSAMVIAVCAFAFVLDPARRRVGTGIGSAAPTPRRAVDAEEFLAAALPWEARTPVPPATAVRFGELVAAAASPIDDVRGTAGYRRHALSVLARRTLGWAWADYRRGEQRRCG